MATASSSIDAKLREEIMKAYLEETGKGKTEEKAKPKPKKEEYFTGKVKEPTSFNFDYSDWDEISQIHIPSAEKFENYSPDAEALKVLDMALRLKQIVLMQGDPSVGKSSLAEYYCSKNKVPFYRIQGRGDLETAALLGGYVVEDGMTRWIDGLFTQAVRNGGVLLFDEPFITPPEIEAALRGIMEQGGRLVLSDKHGAAADKIVTPHKNFRLILADNTHGFGDEHGDFAGVNAWNIAALDRIGCKIRMDYLPKKDEVAMLRKVYPEATELLIERTVDFANLCRNAYRKRELALPCGPRALFNIIQNALVYQDIKKGIFLAYQGKLGNDAEVSAVNGFIKTAYGIN